MAPLNLRAMCIGVVYTVATGIQLHGGPACAMRQSMSPLRAEIALPAAVTPELASSNDAQPRWEQPTLELTRQASTSGHESRLAMDPGGMQMKMGGRGKSAGPHTPGYGADLEPPFEISDAAVRGFASAQVQAAFDAELKATTAQSMSSFSSRRLLHGSRRPARYPTCNRCLVIRCSRGVCNGHCKRDRKVLNCSGLAEGRLPRCRPEERSINAIPVSPLNPPDSIVVTAPAPYIGCAETANQDSGCPAIGTRGTMDNGGNTTATLYRVQFSTCSSQRYLPDCEGSPLHPFGICQCLRIAPNSSRRLGYGPCNVTELELDKSPPAQGEIRVALEERDNVTVTSFADYTEPGDRSHYFYSVAVPIDDFVRGVRTRPVFDVDVELEIFAGVVVDASPDDISGTDGTVSDDYYDESAEEENGGGGPSPRTLSPVIDCISGYNPENQAVYYDYYCFYDPFEDYVYIPFDN